MVRYYVLLLNDENPVYGTALGGHALAAPVNWDGMAAAGRRLFLSTADGRLVCMASVDESGNGPAAIMD